LRRLYRKIYLTIVLALLAVVAVGAGIQWFGRGPGPFEQGVELASELAGAALPPPEATPEEQTAALRRLAARLEADLALFDANRRVIALSGEPIPPPPPRAVDGPGLMTGGPGPAWGLRLPDGRWLMMRLPPRGPRHPLIAVILFLGAIAGVVALFAYPVVRGLTRRIERLQQGVETLGAGNFSTRVKVEGRDEVASLAQSFNEAAARIEALMGAHRMLLANASHELRTPLSRIRMGLELLRETGDEKYRTAIRRDLDELDELIEDILLSSRLEAGPGLQFERVDLLPVVAEECARFETVEDQLEAAVLLGDSRLLRHMVRNLLENARRHGGPPIRVALASADGEAILDVKDGGEGSPDMERERVFEPFYQVKGSARGTGLGLALVRRIARLHGGDARAVPDPTGRSFLQVRLPLTRTT
jgi:signal transduction histidine kinase